MNNYSTVRKDLQRLITNLSGRTVFILGGGSSVTPEMLNYLNRSENKVVALNSAFKFITSPAAILWCDSGWGATNHDALSAHTCPKFAVTNCSNYSITKDVQTTAGATPLNYTGEFGFDSNIDNVRGNNSGANAINLLVNCKVSTIILVGFDMYATNTTAHFHSEYTYTIRPAVYGGKFIPCINSMADVIRDSGVNVKIYNSNSASALKCFEFMELDIDERN